MPRGKKRGFGFASQLTSMVNKLKEQRAIHANALRQVDAIFEKIGITTHLAETEEKPRRGRPPGRKPGRPAGKRGPGRPKATATSVNNGLDSGSTKSKKGKRGSFTTTGPESILAFVKKAGAKGATGAEITKHWNSEGRGAGIYVVIGKMTKAKKLKKQKIEGGRGSRYTAG